MKVILLLLVITLFSCTNISKLDGTYKHATCGENINCNYFEFFEKGNFRYNVIKYTTQHLSFNGSWSLNDDTVYLKPYPYIAPDSTKVELHNIAKDSKTIISINMLNAYEKGQKPDTLRTQWFVSLDNGINYMSTDSLGRLSLNKQYISKIKIQDIMKHWHNLKIFANNDSVFEVNAAVNKINIYIAMPIKIDDELDFMPKKLLWKKNTIYPIDHDDNIIRLVSKRNYYKRTTNKTQK